MKQALFIGAIASVLVINSVIADTTVTSKQYVDTTRQATIPASGTNSSTPGSTVVTYTDTAGTIGERGICDEDRYSDGDCNGNDLLDNSVMNVVFDQISEATTNLPETTVTYKTCYQEVNGECILWNLSDKDVYGKCRNHGDCAWMTAQCDSGLVGVCITETGKCDCGSR